MDIGDERDYVYNVGLMKLTGLYQVLDFGTTTRLRGRKPYYVAIAFLLLYHFVVSVILLASVWYYWRDNLSSSIVYLFKTEVGFFTCYQIWIIIYHSDGIRNVLSITWYGFTSYGLPNKREILDRWRVRSIRFTNLMTAVYVLGGVSYVGSLLLFRNVKKPLTNHDGTVGIYRENTVNLYLFVSAETYNSHFSAFYFAESFFIPSDVVIFIMFDTALVSLCLAICCQFQIVCASFESVGYAPLLYFSTPETCGHLDETENISNDHDLIYDRLISILKDHQAVIENLENFLTVFKKMMMIKFVTLSSFLIALCFTVIMNLSNQDKYATSIAETIEMIVPIPSIAVQFFMLCYLFEMINNQKDSIIFALYSSNWTEMNLKCRKLIILIMKMNNANEIKLKFTRTRIVNLEMFFKTMGNCYTVISVLINCLIKKDV